MTRAIFAAVAAVLAAPAAAQTPDPSPPPAPTDQRGERSCHRPLVNWRGAGPEKGATQMADVRCSSCLLMGETVKAIDSPDGESVGSSGTL